MIRYCLICIVLFGCWCNTCLCAATELTSIREILERVRQRYAAADFEADFVQESRLKFMGIVDVAKGRIYFKRPAMMRWHYKTPEEYLIITDGKTVWIYRPEENQVMLGKAADHFGSAKGAEFFSDPTGFLDDFVAELAPGKFQEKGRHVIRFIPKTDRPNLSELFLSVSKRTFDIVGCVSHNAFGDKTSLRFFDFKFHRGLDLSLFVFKIPADADVVRLNPQQGGHQP
ncbi:MAG: outer membrane lipoprotein carrier protein LolA [Desulfobacterales bacterium]|nr:outer membrane lipoprotein carrier protein LolA [Desulfobacterales bacterium]